MATKAGNPRGTAQWRRVSELVRKRDGYSCVLCGRGRNDGTRLHVDHVIRLADGGDPFDPMNLQTLCQRCHAQKTSTENVTTGRRLRNLDRYRAALQAQPRQQRRQLPDEPVRSAPVPVIAAETKRDLLTEGRNPAQPLALISDGSADVDPHFDGATPRFAVKAHARAISTDAPDLAAWGKGERGLQLRPWQRFVLDRALERDADGRLCWPTVVVLTPRQSGKSTLLQLLATYWGSQGLQVLHVANRLSTASEVWQHAARWGELTGLRVLRKQDQPELIWTDVPHPIRQDQPGRYFVQAAKPTAGVGFTLDRAVVDEAFTVSMPTVTQGIAPAMADVADRQLWLISTAGEQSSELLRHYRDAGIASVRGEHDRVCLIEWSAPETADWTSPDVWKACSPHWTDSRAEYLAEQMQLIPEQVFRSQYLNQWIQTVAGWIPPTSWDAIAETDDDGGQWKPISACVEQTLDGSTHCIVEAGLTADGLVRTRYTQCSSVGEAESYLDQIRAPHTRMSPSYIGRFARQRDLIGQRELDPAMRTVADLIGRRGVRHPDDPRLTESALSAVERVPHTGTGISLGSPTGANLSPIRAWAWAVWLAAANPARKPVIVSRRVS